MDSLKIHLKAGMTMHVFFAIPNKLQSNQGVRHRQPVFQCFVVTRQTVTV